MDGLSISILSSPPEWDRESYRGVAEDMDDPALECRGVLFRFSGWDAIACICVFAFVCMICARVYFALLRQSMEI